MDPFKYYLLVAKCYTNVTFSCHYIRIFSKGQVHIQFFANLNKLILRNLFKFLLFFTYFNVTIHERMSRTGDRGCMCRKAAGEESPGFTGQGAG